MLLLNTWEDGSTRSQNNAFTWQSPPATPQQTKSAKRYDKLLAARGETRADTARRKAERVNKNIDISAHCGLTHGQKAPR